MVERTKLEKLCDEDVISPLLLAKELGIDEREIAGMFEPSLESVLDIERNRSSLIQTRLHEMVEILSRVEPLMGSSSASFAWFRSEGLPSFDGTTAEQLVKEGRASSVHRYLDRMLAGGYA